MARVQFTISDEDRDRLVEQARADGVSLSEWLRRAAKAHLDYRKRAMSRKSLIEVYRELVPEAEQVDPLKSPIPIAPFFRDVEVGNEVDPAEEAGSHLKDKLVARGLNYPPRTGEDLRAFFDEIDALNGTEVEPDWEDNLRVLDESIREGLPDV